MCLILIYQKNTFRDNISGGTIDLISMYQHIYKNMEKKKLNRSAFSEQELSLSYRVFTRSSTMYSSYTKKVCQKSMENGKENENGGPT